jgi:uncharacterized protein (TIGR00251 family)
VRAPADAVTILERDGAALLTVHVVPGARRAGVLGVHGEALRLAVRAAPERGRANAELVEALARMAGVRRSQVTVVSGHTSRRKRVRIDGVRPAELRRTIASM